MAKKTHWSRDMFTLWWRDAGSLRMRVSFDRDKDRLLRRIAGLYHDEIDAALYSPDGTRLHLSYAKMGESPEPTDDTSEARPKRSKAVAAE